MKKITYRSSGVDIKKAISFTKNINDFIYNSRLSKISAFGCPFDLKDILKNYNSPVLVSSTDGVGTKLKIAQFLNIHNTVGIDLVAMNVNDVICLGAKPLFFLDYIACNKLNQSVLYKILEGIYLGLKESDCVLIGGETAQMGDFYKKDEYDLAGFCVGIVDKNKIINGNTIEEKDLIIGLESNGLHSNGFSLVRKVFSKKEIIKYKDILLKPTKIYVKPILDLLNSNLGSFIKGIAHITGGAFYNKATKILKDGYSMIIEKRSWEVPEIFKIIQKKAKVDDKEMYSVFNMGIGMILVINKDYAYDIVNYLKNLKINSYIIGSIKKDKVKIKFL